MDGSRFIATVVPDLERERARLGRATLGTFSEVDKAAERARRDEQRATLRPWRLWGVLVAGVAALALMVWRLARGSRRDPARGPAPTATPSPPA